jgi:hypothetical protein
MRSLRGYKTYISAAAILVLALAGLSGVSVEELVAEADRLATALLALAAVYGRWDKERRAPDPPEVES